MRTGPRYLYDFHGGLGRLEWRVSQRSRHETWGRFGGGWQWKLGAQWSSSSIIISLLVLTVHLHWKRG